MSFDECLNKVKQMEQMGVIVNYWSEREEKVAVYFFLLFKIYGTYTDREAFGENQENPVTT